MDNNQPIKKVAMNWAAPGMGAVVKCPVEGCSHTTVNLITKAHLRIEHGLTREEVAAKYGYPEIVKMKGFIVNDKASHMYNSVANYNSF